MFFSRHIYRKEEGRERRVALREGVVQRLEVSKSCVLCFFGGGVCIAIE